MSVVRVYFSLLILLAITVGLSLVHLPLYLGVGLSLLVATLKASLVLLFFMRVRSMVPSLRIFALGALVWVVLLLALTLGDYATRGSWDVLGK
jgi:cytochrome c oxidase subunit 4